MVTSPSGKGRIIVTTTLLTPRTIPLRAMNRAPSHANVLGSCAAWHCVCGNPVALQGRSGSPAGPTRDTVVVCNRCNRVYFVIPMDRSHGPPIEVVELFGLPEPQPEHPVSAQQ
jgi:hypothetical protein